ncbi:hypothetical protein ACRBEF_17520 [Yersinia proxima]|uniref:hypothetical protein n=1 Tax=Yersinia proxima TaxID=2890316 RepID=UPI001D1025A8|nr:hypothetical protein [Yersinia proxima]
MDVKNNLMEKTILKLKKTFFNYFDWNSMDVNYARVDTLNKSIFAMPSNYEWHLIYFDENLDLNTSERLTPGVQHWNNYSYKFSEALKKSHKKGSKVDICTQHNSVFEIITVNSINRLSFADMVTIYKWKPVIADYAHREWCKHQDIVLPLRENITLPMNRKKVIHSSDELLNIHPYMRFGDLKFTQKEIITIRLLLSHRKVKEICAIQGCSLTSEHKRIQRIKEKLNCQHHSLGGLFNVLKENGITLACLDTQINFP